MKTFTQFLLLLSLLAAFAQGQSISLPHQRSTPFIWGINGHPLTQQAYNNSSGYQDQLNYLKQLNLTYYRVDMPQHADGTVVASANLTNLLTVLDANPAIKLLPVIGLSVDATSLATKSNSQFYALGVAQGYQFAAQYGNRFKTLELGNELDNQSIITVPCYDANGVMKQCDVNGDVVTHYDPAKIARIANYLKGLKHGIDSTNQGIKTIVNAAGWLHYGFFKCLANHGVNYDILGYHFYSDFDTLATAHILDTLASFNKDIWFTEFNARPAIDVNRNVIVGTSDALQVTWTPAFMEKLYNDDRVKAAFVYELYNEKALGGTEAYQGIVDCLDGNCTSSTRTNRPGFNPIKYKREELEYGHEDFVLSLYVNLLCARPDNNGLAYWTGRLKSSNDKAALASAFINEAYLEERIEEIYQSVLGHAGNPEGRAYWMDQANQGMRWEDIIKLFCWSQEFWQASGSTNSGFVEHLYVRLLGRPSGPNDQSLKTSLINQLNNYPADRNPAINAIMQSDEYLTNYVTSQFSRLLKRSTYGDVSWVNRMKNGLTQKELMISLITSDEYWNNTVVNGYKIRQSPNWSVANCTLTNINSAARLVALNEPTTSGLTLSVYPNPTDGQLTVGYGADEEKAAVVRIYNVLGITVKQQTLYPGKNTVNLTQLPPGVYTIQVPGKGLSKRVILR